MVDNATSIACFHSFICADVLSTIILAIFSSLGIEYGVVFSPLTLSYCVRSVTGMSWTYSTLKSALDLPFHANIPSEVVSSYKNFLFILIFREVVGTFC